MINKIKIILKKPQYWIIIYAGIGLFCIAISFEPAYEAFGYHGASINPILFTFGGILIIIAWLKYKKWISDLNNN